MTKQKKKMAILIFVLVLTVLVGWSIANITIATCWLNYLELDLEHNYVTWLGVDYGTGMGSISFCSRASAAGWAGLMLAGMSCWIFPTWLKVKGTKPVNEMD